MGDTAKNADRHLDQANKANEEEDVAGYALNVLANPMELGGSDALECGPILEVPVPNRLDPAKPIGSGDSKERIAANRALSQGAKAEETT